MNEPDKVWSFQDERPKEPYRYAGCGLEDVWLVSGYDVEIDDGEEFVIIRDLDGLHNAIGRELVERTKLLGGKEIRFLRTQMDFTQSELARLIGCDAQQIARYEKDKNNIPGPADRLLRMIFQEHLDGRISVRDILTSLDEMDSRNIERHVFAETAEGWRSAA